jgi:hypothetical protein
MRMLLTQTHPIALSEKKRHHTQMTTQAKIHREARGYELAKSFGRPHLWSLFLTYLSLPIPRRCKEIPDGSRV